RDVVVLDGGPDELARYADADARVTAISGPAPWTLPDASADVSRSVRVGFRGVTANDLAEADRILRPGGRLLVVHDYGRDDVSPLRGDLGEHGDVTRPGAPRLTA